MFHLVSPGTLQRRSVSGRAAVPHEARGVERAASPCTCIQANPGPTDKIQELAIDADLFQIGGPMKTQMTPLTKKARSILVRRAKDHDLITFASLARKIGGVPPRNLGPMLDAIDNADVAAGRPSLACIVVSAEKLVKPKGWKMPRAKWMKERRALYRWYGQR